MRLVVIDICPVRAIFASGTFVESMNVKVNVAFSPNGVFPGLSIETYVLRAIVVTDVDVESSL